MPHLKHALMAMLLLIPALSGRARDHTRIRQDLEAVHRSDQAARAVLDSLVRRAGLAWSDPAIQALLPGMRQTDSLNLLCVMRILDTAGWPARAAVGSIANEAAFLVIQHADSATMSYYFPLLLQSAATGGSPRRYAAMMHDRILTERGYPQLYGTQISMTRREGRFLLFPVADPGSLDRRRRQAGLPPIRRWARAAGVYVGKRGAL